MQDYKVIRSHYSSQAEVDTSSQSVDSAKSSLIFELVEGVQSVAGAARDAELDILRNNVGKDFLR